MLEEKKAMMNFDDEQAQLIGTVEDLLKECSGTVWGKYKGDVTCRVVLEYIRRHLPKAYTVVGPNVYIQDNPVEFDLLVVDAQARPLDFTTAYRPDQVQRVMEIKKFGIIAEWGEKYDAKLRRLHEAIRSSLRDSQWVKAFYLSLTETINPVRKTSHRYGAKTKEILEQEPLPVRVYILHDLGQHENIKGEWGRFIADLIQGL